MRETRADTQQPYTLEKALAVFINALSGKNRSAATIRAYQTDIQQFIVFLHEISVSAKTPQDVQKVDILEYLSHLAKKRPHRGRPRPETLRDPGILPLSGRDRGD